MITRGQTGSHWVVITSQPAIIHQAQSPFNTDLTQSYIVQHCPHILQSLAGLIVLLLSGLHSYSYSYTQLAGAGTLQASLLSVKLSRSGPPGEVGEINRSFICGLACRMMRRRRRVECW